MKTTCRTWQALLASLLAVLLLSPLAPGQNRGGAGGKEKGGKGGDGGNGGDGSVITPPKLSPEQLAAFEKSMTAAQKKLFEELVAAQIRLYKEAGGPLAQLKPDEQRKLTMTWIVARAPEQRAEFWKHVPEEIHRLRRAADPLYLSEEQKKLALEAPADTKELVAKVVGDDVDGYLQARRRLIHIGAPCLPLVTNEAARFGPEDTRHGRLVEILNQIEANQAAEKMILIIEASEKRLAVVKKQAAKDSNVVLLLSREVTSYGLGGASRLDPRAQNCYYSFPKAKHGYNGAVSLGFGNGSDSFDVLMYGGQDNRLNDLGKVDFAGIKSIPGPKETAKWKERATAVVGHVYLEHCVEPRDNVNQAAAFKVLDLQPGQWVIIEWKTVPQAKDPS